MGGFCTRPNRIEDFMDPLTRSFETAQYLMYDKLGYPSWQVETDFVANSFTRRRLEATYKGTARVCLTVDEYRQGWSRIDLTRFDKKTGPQFAIRAYFIESPQMSRALLIKATPTHLLAVESLTPFRTESEIHFYRGKLTPEDWIHEEGLLLSRRVSLHDDPVLFHFSPEYEALVKNPQLQITPANVKALQPSSLAEDVLDGDWHPLSSFASGIRELFRGRDPGDFPLNEASVHLTEPKYQPCPGTPETRAQYLESVDRLLLTFENSTGDSKKVYSPFKWTLREVFANPKPRAFGKTAMLLLIGSAVLVGAAYSTWGTPTVSRETL